MVKHTESYTLWFREVYEKNKNRIISGVTNRKEFKKILKKKQILIIKASATWCKPCKDILPVFFDLFEALPRNIKLLEIDVDNHRDLVTFFGIKSVPTFISYNSFDRMDILVGSNKKDLYTFFQKILEYNGNGMMSSQANINTLIFET